MNRREFVSKLARTGFLAAFAVMIGVFASQGKITRSSECVAEFQCKGCRKLKDCRLPESEKTRKNG
jgi:hypothetical protein